MPAVSAIRTGVIEKLAGELRFAGKSTLMRHLERIEGLVGGIEKDGVYPADFLVFRVTGYRPDEGSDVFVDGEAVLGDLSALAERLSEAAGLVLSDVGVLGEDYETIDSLCARWGVSRKTVERYRRLGLVARRVDLGSGHRGVVFGASVVGGFEERHKDRLGMAEGYSRMGEGMIEKIVRDAARYHRRLGWKRSRVCARISQRIGRSGESVRRVLIEHDDRCAREGLLGEVIFGMKGGVDDRERLEMLAMSLEGKRSGTIGARYGRGGVSVNRAVNRARRGLILEAGFGRDEAYRALNDELMGQEVLSEALVVGGLSTRGARDLAGLIEQMRAQHAAVVYEQTARARAAEELGARCDWLARGLNASVPSGRVLDEIETLMRWMVKLRIELVGTQLSLMLSTIEARIGGPIDSLAPGRGAEILSEAIGVVYGVVERFEATEKGRLAAPVGLAMARWCSRLDDVAVAAVEGRAGRRVVEGYGVEDWTVDVWRGCFGGAGWGLMPGVVLDGVVLDGLVMDSRVIDMVGDSQLSDQDREMLVRRFGLGGERPLNLAEMGEWLGTPAMHAGRMVQGAIRRVEEMKK